MASRPEVHFFAYMPRTNATARQRAYHVAELLSEKRGLAVHVHAPLAEESYRRYATPHGMSDRILWLAEMVIRRSVQVFRVRPSSTVMIQRELLPVGPDYLERLLRRKTARLILDIDDATYAFAGSRPHSRVGRMLMSEGKFERMCRAADVVVCGSEEIAAHARSFARTVLVIPTSLDFPPMPLRPADEESGILRLGWLGNPGNLASLAVLAEPIRRLRMSGLDVRLRVMSARPPSASEAGGLDVEFVHWTLEGEERFLTSVDVGVMPLSDDEYSRGKCGFKLLRYIASGVPVIGSPVGVNEEILRNGNGVVVDSPAAWEDAIARFSAMGQSERREMARRAYEWALPRYSLASAVTAWDELLSGGDL